MAVSDSVQDEGLVRVIGTGALGSSVVNMVVRAGIFVLPGLKAELLAKGDIVVADSVSQCVDHGCGSNRGRDPRHSDRQDGRPCSA